MRKWLRTPVVVAVISAALLVVLVAPAGAGAGRNLQISGDGVVLGPGAECDGVGSELTLELTAGSLVGCWYTDIDEDSVKFTPSGTYQERGTETFDGQYWVDGVMVAEGTFSTTYHFTGKFDDLGGEIFGRCQHPIVSGTGDFAGVTGRVDFKDVDPANGILEYRGHIRLANGT